MNYLMKIFSGLLDNITIVSLFLVVTSFSLISFMIVSLRHPTMERASLDPLSILSLPLIRVVTKATKLATHVVPKVGRLIDLVTPSHMLNCDK